MTHRVSEFCNSNYRLITIYQAIDMKRPYQIPLTQKVLFVGNTDTLKFSDITTLSGPGDPSAAPQRLVPVGNKSTEL